jgi:hypothetical protein
VFLILIPVVVPLTQNTGLFVRPPYQDEEYANWKNSAAGMKENDDGWVYVPPMEDTFTVILGKSNSIYLAFHVSHRGQTIGKILCR